MVPRSVLARSNGDSFVTTSQIENSEAFDIGVRACGLWQAYAEGASASNPYDEGTKEFQDWEAGWAFAAS